MLLDEIKRFTERWSADLDFRDALNQDAPKAAADYGFDLDPETLRPIWDAALEELAEAEDKTEMHRQYPAMKLYQDHLDAITLHDVLERKGDVADERFRAWRLRQEYRTLGQFPKYHTDKILHIAAAFELSLGCSVGCWFCGLAASKLKGVFRYSREHAQLWQGVLTALKGILGPAAGTSICYWATEPLDNPDYESFCLDMHRITGVFPHTTTAVPLRDVERTRRLMKLSLSKGCGHNRFSLPSLQAWKRIHEVFSPEELRTTILKTYSKGSAAGFAISGRATLEREKLEQEGYSFAPDLTIACVSGFLVNMVERSLKLITPCVPSEKWPLGYAVLDQTSFDDATSFEEELNSLVDRNLHAAYPGNAVLRFREDLEFKALDDGFEVATRYLTRRYRNHPYLRDLGNMISQGGHTLEQIISAMLFYAVPASRVRESVDLMFRQGVLAEPRP